MRAGGGHAGNQRMNKAFGTFYAINSRIETVFASLAGLFLGLFTVVVFVDVIYRQVLQQPMMWPSEWAVMSFVWSVMLGACVSARRNIHFVVELLPDLTGTVDLVLKVIVALLSIVFGLVLLYYGWGMAAGGLKRFTPMMGYPMVYVFAAFPVAGATITLFMLEHLLAATMPYGKVPEVHSAGGGFD